MFIDYTKEEKKEFEKQIDTFFERNGLIKKKNNDIFAIGTKLGFKIFSMPLPDGYDGVIAVERDFKAIGIDEKADPIKARFTVAHEIAHYIRESANGSLDSNGPIIALKDRIFHNEDKSKEEQIADYMAAAILVPFDEFKKDLLDNGLSLPIEYSNAQKLDPILIENLATSYNVEPNLIIRRIAEVY